MVFVALNSCLFLMIQSSWWLGCRVWWQLLCGGSKQSCPTMMIVDIQPVSLSGCQVQKSQTNFDRDNEVIWRGWSYFAVVDERWTAGLHIVKHWWIPVSVSSEIVYCLVLAQLKWFQMPGTTGLWFVGSSANHCVLLQSWIGRWLIEAWDQCDGRHQP